jgi:hypothetical protein
VYLAKGAVGVYASIAVDTMSIVACHAAAVIWLPGAAACLCGALTSCRGGVLSRGSAQRPG